MAYEKQIWACGDVTTTERLNHMEKGIDDANNASSFKVSFYVEPSNPNVILADKTYDEIVEAFEQGKLVWGTFDKSRVSGTAWITLFLSFYGTGSGSNGLNFTNVRGNGTYLEVNWMWFDKATNTIAFNSINVM